MRNDLPLPDFAALRRNMVDAQLRTYDVTSHRVLDAIERTPRDLFVPEKMRELAYTDRDITVAAGEGATRELLRPMILARLLQALEIQPGERVLDCAGGSGYGAAVLAALGAQVTAIETTEPMAALMRQNLAAAGVSGIDVKVASLGEGLPASGLFDVILVHGSAEREPEALIAQLSEGGRLGIFLGRGRSGRAVVIGRSGAAVGRRSVFDAAAPFLADFSAKPAFSF